jgi:hypothetical protein
MKDLKFPVTLKAEPLINTYLDYNSELPVFQIDFKGSFQRNYLNDISNVEIHKKSSANVAATKVVLNRDGIYDKLPEGVFHEIDRFVKLGSSGNQKAFKEEYEKQKNEIEYSRKFFNPFDNLFFDLSLQIDQLFSVQTANFQRTIYDFYSSGKSGFSLSEFHLNKIVSFLPFLSKIRANIDHLRFFLTYLFDSEIFIEQVESIKSHQFSSHTYNVLNQAYLSRNMYCGNHYFDFAFDWMITIVTAESKLFKFIEDAEFNQHYDFIKSYLVPAGIETHFIIKSRTIKQMELQKGVFAEQRQYLGFNVTI